MRLFRTTTAIVTVASLAVSGPAVAQGQGKAKGLAKQVARDLAIDLCEADGADVPCVTEDATVKVSAEGLTGEAAMCGDDVPLPCMTEDGFVELDPESELAQQMLAMAQSDDPVASAAPAEGDDAAGTVENAEAEPASSEQEEGTVTGEVETIGDDATESSEMVSEETEGASGDGTEQLANDSNVVAETETEADATAEAETETESDTEMAAEGEADSEATIDAEGVKTVVVEEDAEAETESEATAEAEREAEELIESDVATNEAGEAVVQGEEASAAAAAAADDSTDATAEVEVEEVTEENTRSATEDFETTASGNANATASSGDSGMSNFEKALLIGLGAVAVGSILDNGDEVVANSGDRVVIKNQDGSLRVLKDDDALLRRPGSEVRTETFSDGSTRTIVTREDGTKIVTVRASDGRVVRRARVLSDGTQILLFDDTEEVAPVVVSDLPEMEERTLTIDLTDEDALRTALAREEARTFDRRFSLRQIRQIKQVRELAPEIELDAITFASGSAAIQPSQAEELAALGRTMLRLIDEHPDEVFLVEGHTDAVGNAGYNLALSDRRAETVALALTEYFDVPPENLVTQGYGESQLKIRTLDDERQNRRAVVRRITPLLQMAAR